MSLCKLSIGVKQFHQYVLSDIWWLLGPNSSDGGANYGAKG